MVCVWRELYKRRFNRALSNPDSNISFSRVFSSTSSDSPAKPSTTSPECSSPTSSSLSRPWLLSPLPAPSSQPKRFAPPILFPRIQLTCKQDVALVARQNCQNHIDRCDQNGCAGAYSSNQFIGVCTQGQWAGCPCNRCGNNIGSCNDNGCQGNGGRCTAGLFVGCQCR